MNAIQEQIQDDLIGTLQDAAYELLNHLGFKVAVMGKVSVRAGVRKFNKELVIQFTATNEADRRPSR